MRYRLVKEKMPNGNIEYYTEKCVWWMPFWVFVYNSLRFNYDDAVEFFERLKNLKVEKTILDKYHV